MSNCLVPAAILDVQVVAITVQVAQAQECEVAGVENVLLCLLGKVACMFDRKCAERQSVCDNAQFLKAVELRSQALDVSLVVELALLEEVGISLLPLAALDRLLLFGGLELVVYLAIAAVDQAVRIPKDAVHTLFGAIVEIRKLCALAGYAGSNRN